MISYSHIALFFFTDTPTTEIYTLSLHDALPICFRTGRIHGSCGRAGHAPLRLTEPMSLTSAKVLAACASRWARMTDRKSTRLNSSHVAISYAVFCLKKKKKISVSYIPEQAFYDS